MHWENGNDSDRSWSLTGGQGEEGGLGPAGGAPGWPALRCLLAPADWQHGAGALGQEL